jgi:hypothetical protein
MWKRNPFSLEIETINSLSQNLSMGRVHVTAVAMENNNVATFV